MEFLNINPIFLFILFAMGYVFGLLIRNPSAGKFVIFGFFGIFIYEPVKDAGLLASAAFIFGIIVHHISLLSIFDSFQLYQIKRTLAQYAERDAEPEFEQPAKEEDEDLGPKGGAGQRSESADETHQKFEEFTNRHRQKKAEEQQWRFEQKNKAAQEGAQQAEQEKMRREREDIQREKDRLEKERNQFNQEQASYFAHDSRTAEEVLGLSGRYSFEDLKKARNAEARRWNPSNMANKPKHLVKQAEEESKMINLAFEKLKKNFG